MDYGTVSDLDAAREHLAEALDALRDARDSIRREDEPMLRGLMDALIEMAEKRQRLVDERQLRRSAV